MPEEKSAVQRVFDIPELLEKILLAANLKTVIINVQRVNKQWNTAVNTSPAIQHALFFRATSKPMVPDPTKPPELNMLLSPRDGMFFASPPNTTIPDGMYCLLSQPRTWPEAFMYPKASWRKMLFSRHLPVAPTTTWTRYGIQDLRHGTEINQFDDWDVERDAAAVEYPAGHGNINIPQNAGVVSDGLRMGVLYDMLVEWFWRNRPPTFTIFWISENVSHEHGIFPVQDGAGQGGVRHGYVFDRFKLIVGYYANTEPFEGFSYMTSERIAVLQEYELFPSGTFSD